MVTTSPPRAAGSRADLLRWRMTALGLTCAIDGGDPGATGADLVTAVGRHMMALQGQDWPAAQWALGVRAPGTTSADVRSAFDAGRLVRSWPMRGTVHVTPAEDIGWIQCATSHRVLPGAAKRRAQIGLDDESLRHMADVAVDLLTGGGAASRETLARAWIDAGIEVRGPWRYHVVWWLCQNGILVQGPAPDGEPLLVLADEWITAPRALEGEEALAELAYRFVAAHGPVLDRDLAWWTGLSLTEARRGISAAAASGRIVSVDIEARTHWARPELLDGPVGSSASADRLLLLPGFDEHLLGYADRSAAVDPQHFPLLVPGRNGVFRATVVDGGRVVGTWQRSRRDGVWITVSPFPGRRLSARRVAPAARRWAEFTGTLLAGVDVAAVDRGRTEGVDRRRPANYVISGGT